MIEFRHRLVGNIFNVNDLIAYHRPAVGNILSRNHAKQYLSPREALFIIIVRRYNAPTFAKIFRLPAFDAPSAVLTWQANVLYIFLPSYSS